MEFAHRNKKGETVSLPIRIVRSPDHQELYVHGATGAALGNYHFRIDFYRDVFPPWEYTVEGGEMQDDLGPVERTVLTSLYLPMPFLKELRNWLDKNIAVVEQQHGEIVLPKGEEAKAAQPPLPKTKRQA